MVPLALVTVSAVTTILAGEVEIATLELPWAAVHRAYSPPPLEVRTAGKCASGGVGYSVVSGELPVGLSLSGLGYFSGEPARTGTYHFTVRASNGCSWTARLFALVVAEPPVLAIAPGAVKLVWRRKDVGAPAGVLHVASTWPGLRYRFQVTGDWLRVSPEHGFLARGGGTESPGAVASDTIVLRVTMPDRKPGRYSTPLEISAWQAEPVRATVELIVEEP